MSILHMITREEFDALKQTVAEHQRIIDSQWTALQQAGMRTMVFGPGDNDYGRDTDRMKAFEDAVREFNAPKATQEKTNGELLAQ